MAPTIESGVQERMQDPDEESHVTLLVKVESQSDDVLKAVAGAAESVTIQKKHRLNYLRVSVLERDLEDLYNTEGIVSLEIEGSGEVMSSDFRTPDGQVP